MDNMNSNLIKVIIILSSGLGMLLLYFIYLIFFSGNVNFNAAY